MKKRKLKLSGKLVILIIAIVLMFVLFYTPKPTLTGFAIIEQDIQFDQGENLIAVISGNFIEQITKENIIFYRGHISGIPMNYDVVKIGTDFYVYALLLGKPAGNYSLVVDGVSYWNGIQISEERIIKNFTITENSTDFFVNPGVVLTNGNFSFEITNFKNVRRTIELTPPDSFITQENSFDLISGQTKVINFEINLDSNLTSQTLEYIQITSESTEYQLPVFFYPELINNQTNPIEVDGPETNDSNFKITPSGINLSMYTNSNLTKIFYILNQGLRTENISLVTSQNMESYLNVSPEFISVLEENSTEQIEINFTSGEEEIRISGHLFAISENFTTPLFINLEIIENPNSSEPSPRENSLPYCRDLEGGKVCPSGEMCSISTNLAMDEDNEMVYCCLGNCEPLPEKPATGKIIGWIIIVVIIVVLVLFFLKHKRIRPKVDLLDIAKGKKRSHSEFKPRNNYGDNKMDFEQKNRINRKRDDFLP
ncbi:hypothetical protein K0A97_01440 [Patescibacteria group bacterium]|nr:hypothetical protein [Patescibacteria group bacterium]